MAALFSMKSAHAVLWMSKSRSFISMNFPLIPTRSVLQYLKPCFLNFHTRISRYDYHCKLSTCLKTATQQNYRISTRSNSCSAIVRSPLWPKLHLPKFTNICTVMQSTTSATPVQLKQEQKPHEKIDQDKTGQEHEAKTPPPPPNPDFSARAMKYTLVGFGLLISGMSGFLVMAWGQEQMDEAGTKIKDEYSDLPQWKAYILRTWREINYYDKLIKEPSREKLLPDPLTEPYYQPPYTLVMEMTGVLVHPDWTYKTGWRFKKRPAVDYFLQQVGPPLYEVVIYTSEQGFTAFPILDTLDPNGFIMYRLFRDATRYTKGHHIKDLSCLNRDLSKVIFIDWNEKSFQMQPENAFKLKKWQGNDEDRSLVDLAAFLRTIATSQVDDVRTVLAFYKQFDDPLAAFKANQQRLHEEQQRMASSQSEFSDRSLSWTRSFFKRWQQ